MEKVLFLQGFLEKAPWGSSYFREKGMTDSNLKYGAYVSCKASKKESVEIAFGQFKGQKLIDVFNNNRELFNNIPSKEFPLMVKLIKSKLETSIKVHPNDDYAALHDNSLGRTMGWLILDASPESELILGVKAKDKESLMKLYNEKKMSDIVNIVKPKVGQFFPIYSGTIHSIGRDVLLRSRRLK